MQTQTVLMTAALLFSVGALGQTADKQLTAQEMPLLMTYSCAVGAVEAAYTLAGDKLPGSPGKDAVVIANASKAKCITPGYISALVPTRGRPISKDQLDEIAVLANARYMQFVSDIVTSRAGSQGGGKQ